MGNAILTPTSLLAKLRIRFGATDTGSTDRVTLLTDALKLSAGYVWRYARWGFRHRVLTLTTTAAQNFTTLPSDYERDAQAGDWLTDGNDNRPVYVSPAQFAVESARLDSTSGVPEIWTLGNETIAGVVTPVARWAPTPDAEYNFEGFQYFAAMPDIAPVGGSGITLTGEVAAFTVVDDGGSQALLSASGSEAGYTNNYQLFPDAPADADALYIGAASAFSKIVADMSATVQVYDAADVLAWTYWNGAWVALTIASDGTGATGQDGDYFGEQDGTMSFVPPADWAAATVNGQEAYWIRAVIQAGKAAHMTTSGIAVNRALKTLMPSIALDILWDRAATRMAADDLAKPEGIAVPSWAVLIELLEDARSKYGYRSIHGSPHDYYRDSDDLPVLPGGGLGHDLVL